MQRMKTIRLWIGLVYLVFLLTFLYFLFSNFSIKQITSYSFIKSTSEYLTNISESNLFLISIIFITLGIIWISLLQGFGSIIVLASGFTFGAHLGTGIAVITLSLSAGLTYIIASYFFKDLIKKKFTNRFKFLKEKIKSNEFLMIFLLRIVPGTPLQVQNLLPVLFNVKIKNLFFASLLGFLPPAYIFSALGSGLENQINKNFEPPSFLQMITSFEIYAPILAFFFFLLLTYFLKFFFFKK